MQKSWHTHIFREEKMKFIDRFLSFENKTLLEEKAAEREREGRVSKD